MDSTVEVSPSLTSPFELGQVDPDITVVEGPAVLTRGRESLTMDQARVFVSCRPKMDLRFEAEGESNDPVWLERTFAPWEPRRISFPDWDADGALYRNAASVGGDLRSLPFKLSAGGHVRELAIGRARRLKSALFHLPNFLEYIGTPITNGSGWWTGRLELDDGEWRVTIDQRRDLGKIKERLREQGGYAITHVCRVDKRGDRFSADEARDIVHSLHWLLSFVKGAWTSPCLIVGEPARSGSIWQNHTVGRLDRWGGAFTWCDQFEPQSMLDAFTGYRSLWQQPHWRQGLRTAIGLYVTANRPDPLEVAIIAAQSGLELLGWLTLVETRRVAPNDWRNPHTYPAHKKIRDLLAGANINPAIPTKLRALRGLDPSWNDGPDIVAGVRNRLVHPRSTASSVAWPHDVLRETWLLSSRYLELMLLHALEVRSQIRDRLGSPHAGATVKPPWV